MITVTYTPAYEDSPFENGDRERIFETHAVFKDWVKSYVCSTCLLDFKDLYGEEAISVSDYLDMGCGCELEIDDPNDLIQWDEPVN